MILTAHARVFFICFVAAGCASPDLEPDPGTVPGVVIDHSPASSERYIGSPSLALLPNGHYVVSHDFFGPGTNFDSTAVFRSTDSGRTWQCVSRMRGQWWSTLFRHRGALYLIGTSREYGRAVIRRSLDEGFSWTEPNDANTGLLSDESDYHCAPVPLVVHNGRIWRAYERSKGKRSFWQALVISCAEDADLLQRNNWTESEPLAFPWPDTARGQWIEGNMVVTPDGKLANFLRTNGLGADKAAVLHVSADGRWLSFDPMDDLIDFPGGGAKFTIRFDSGSGRYWTLSDKQTQPAAYRNHLVLASSADLREWRVDSHILYHPDPEQHAFQYIDWQFDGDDIVFVSRTAYDDALGGVQRAHDANYMTFHRLSGFRSRTIASPTLNGIQSE